MRPQEESARWGMPYCAEHERLKKAFLEAVREFAELQALQMNAVMDDDPDFVRFDDLIQRARHVKDQAKYALVAHMESHCFRKCCEPDAPIYRDAPAGPQDSQRAGFAVTH